MSQGNLSQQISALERRVGGRLLDRKRSGVELTALGRELVLDARASLTAAQRIERMAGMVLRQESGNLEIATFPSMMAGGLLRALQDWHAQRPRVPIQLRAFANRAGLRRAVASGVGDLGVGPRPEGWTGPVVSLGWESLLLVLPPSLAPRGSTEPIALQDLATERWVTYDKENGLVDIVTNACHLAGFQPLPAVEVSNGTVAAQLAGAGIGPALVPAREIPDDLQVHTHMIQNPITWELTAFTRDEWLPLAREFVDIALTHRWPDRPPRPGVER